MNDLTTFELKIVKIAVRTSWKFRHLLLDEDDARQVALIAVWEARGRIDQDLTEGERAMYLLTRARGAIVDELRKVSHLNRTTGVMPRECSYELLLGDGFDPVHLDTPEGMLQMKQMIARLQGTEHKIILRLAEHLLYGLKNLEIADLWGVTPSRISQHTSELRKVLNDDAA